MSANVSPVVLPALLLLLGAGCGDSLLGSFGLSQNLGLGLEAPEGAAWTMRWYGGLGAATVGSCEVHSATSVNEDAEYGELEMTPPDPLPVPLVTTDRGAFAWSLGIPMVTDGQGIRATATDPALGIWGVSPFHALLVASGDLGALEEDLEIGRADGSELVSGPQWVELFIEEDTPMTLVDSIVVIDQDIEMTAGSGNLPIEALEPDEEHRELLVFATGAAPLGGLDIPSCGD